VLGPSVGREKIVRLTNDLGIVVAVNQTVDSTGPATGDPAVDPAGDPVADVVQVERLRHAVTRLARLLRQQDEGEFGATATSALATVKLHGPITLGDLAGREQVSPPTMTKVVEKLEAHGFVTRATDARDRRVTQVSVTTAGRRHLERTKALRTAWLAERMSALDTDQRQRLATAVEAIEALAGIR